MPLFPSDYPPHIFWTAVGLIVGVLLLLVFVILCGMILHHLRRSRECLHAERLRALEVGHSATFAEPEKSREKYLHNAFWIAFWMGAGVPIAVAWAAASVTMQENVRTGVVLTVWISAAVIGVTGVLCATVLMGIARRLDPGEEQTACRKPAEGDAS